MVQLAKFRYIEFEWDEHNLEEIEAHNVYSEEVEECFFNQHRVYRNKRKFGRNYETYKLDSKTDSGRKLLAIFFVKEKTTARSFFGSVALIRVITAWEI